MSDYFPRELATKIDWYLALVAEGKLEPDGLDLLIVAGILEQHGELLRASRCRALAARLLPNLLHGGRV
jgi:hypothetical protein